MAAFVNACQSLQSDSPSEVDAALHFIRTDPKFRATMEAALKNSGKDIAIVDDRSAASDEKGSKGSEDAAAKPESTPRAGATAWSRSNVSQDESPVELPEQHVAFIAISNFYSCAGKLFHSFPRDMGLTIWRDVYRHGAHSSRVKVAQMCSIMAIGCQYSTDAESVELGKRSYHIAKSYLENALEDDRLQATRIISCLTLFNIMNKSTVALSYIELGLGIFTRYGFNQLIKPLRMQRELWKEMKKVWRTFIFLESWLTSTLGYVPELLIDHCTDNVLQEMYMPDDLVSSDPLAETVQAEMAKVSILAARVVRVLYASQSTDNQALDAIWHDLSSWVSSIPQPLNDESLATMDLKSEHTVPICFIRLIHYGAVMLVYRRVMYDAPREDVLELLNLDDKHLQPAKYVTEGICAARSSARMLETLLDAELLIKRCWLIIYHSFTAAVIILHGIAQVGLSNRSNQIFTSDLELVHSCLRLLAFSAEIDAVAEHFFLSLTPYYDYLVAQLGEGRLPLSSSLNFVPHAQTGPYSSPTDTKSAAEFLFDLVQKPFGEPDPVRGYESDPLLRPFQPKLPKPTKATLASVTSHPYSKYSLVLEPPPPDIAPLVPPFQLDMNLAKSASTGPRLERLSSFASPSSGKQLEAPSYFSGPHATEFHVPPLPPLFDQESPLSSPPAGTPSVGAFITPPFLRKASEPDYFAESTRPAGGFVSISSIQHSGWNRELTQGHGKRRRLDEAGDSDSRWGGGDSGYASVTRGGSFSSAGRTASIVSLVDERRGSGYSEPARTLSAFNELARRESVFSEPARRASTFSDLARRESGFSEPAMRAGGYTDIVRRTSEFSEPARRGSEFSEPMRRVSEFSKSMRRASDFNVPMRREHEMVEDRIGSALSDGQVP